MDILVGLSPYLLIGICLLILLMLVALFIVVRAVRRRPKTEESHDAIPKVDDDTSQATSALALKPYGSPLHLRRSFAHAVKLLQANLAGKDVRYQIPWHVLIGETGSGKTTLLGHTGLSLPLGTPKEEQRGTKAACTWWFFDEGVVLDLAGDYVLRANATSDVKGWQTFLRLLQTYRFKRPIEGVILTIPATELIGPKKLSAKRLNQATHKAAYIYKQLWQAQKLLGMRFPVYILVTKCDQISGFHSFCGELPVRTQHEIFGWSNPYSLENAYAPHWADEAFERLYAELCQIQIEVMADGLQVQDSDGFFLFPTTFQEMFEPLRMYLDQIFKPSVYHESFFFRGLYFCGDSQLEEQVQPGFVEETVGGETEAMATTAPNQVLSTRRKPVFLRHLFEKKIFPEHGLARPLSRTFLSRNRTVLATQLLAVFIAIVGGLGLWRDYNQLSKSEQILLKFLKDSQQEIGELEDKKGRGQGIHQELKDYTKDMVEDLREIDRPKLVSLFIPASWPWFTHIHEGIIESMKVAFKNIIITSIYDGLIDRIKYIKEERQNSYLGCIKNLNTANKENYDISSMREFIEIKCYIDTISHLNDEIQYYNQLQAIGSSDLKDLGELLQDMLDIKVDNNFYSNSYYYNEALRRVEGKEFNVQEEGLQEQAIQTIKKLSQAINDRIFKSNVVLEELQLFSNFTTKIRGFGPEEHPHDIVKTIRETLDSIRKVETLLTKPEFRWLGQKALQLENDPYFTGLQAVLGPIKDVAFLGQALAQEIVQSQQAAFQALRHELLEQEAPYFGKLLHQQENTLELSAQVRTFQIILQTLLALEFVNRETQWNASISALRPDMRLTWNVKFLEDAVGFSEAYHRFNDNLTNHKDYTDLSGMWKTQLSQVARRLLNANMRDLLSQAQHFNPLPERFVSLSQREKILRPDIQNLIDATTPLNNLMAFFEKAGLIDETQQLNHLLMSQAYAQLGRVDELLTEEALYRANEGNFPWLHGNESASFAAFAVQNTEELTYYLDRQRERISYLSRAYAEPLIAVLTQSTNPPAHGREPLLAKWEGILAELDKYVNKKPGNSVTALETFILFDLRDITARNCLEKMMAQDLAEGAGDFFSQHRRRLRRDLLRQCQSLDRKKVFGAYNQIAERFNRTLAGRFPFARNRGAEHDLEAELHAIRSFYHVFDTYGKTAKDLLTRSEDLVAGSRDQALAFLERLEAVRVLFSPFLDAKGTQQIPALDFEVDFRVNKSQEQGGHRIIDWRLAVGEREFRHLDTERRGRWYYGDPIRLSLRWAKDAHRLPIDPQNQAEVEVKDTTVTYMYTNSWSLISFLRRHVASPGDYAYYIDPRPHTLLFRVETKPVGQENDSLPAEENTTKVFVRLRIISSNNQEEMIVPDFPTSAPPLQQDPSQVLSSALDP